MINFYMKIQELLQSYFVENQTFKKLEWSYSILPHFSIKHNQTHFSIKHTLSYLDQDGLDRLAVVRHLTCNAKNIESTIQYQFL